MRILVISDLYPPHYVGGYELNCKDTVDGLINRGNQVTVLTSSWGMNSSSIEGNILRVLNYDPATFEKEYRNGSREFAFIENRISDIRRIFISKKNYALTQRVISQIQPDVVYFWHLWHTTTSPISCILDMGLPFVFRIEDYSFAHLKIQLEDLAHTIKIRYRSIILRMSECSRLCNIHMLVISQAVKNYYMDVGFPDLNMKVLPSGLPSNYLMDPTHRLNNPFRNHDGTIRLVFVGRITPDKGPDIAIQAISMLKNDVTFPSVSLDIIGGGSPNYLENLKLLAARLDVSDSVVFLGMLNSEDVLRRYQYYDALLVTSRWQEPFGRVVIEAMAQGLPVIATQVGGLPEIISDQENGLLVPSGDALALAKAIERLHRQPDLAQHIRDRGILTVMESYTHEHIIDQVEAYLVRVQHTVSVIQDEG
jgi:glycosyltransferase involved in cell wall biosynthesis